MPIASTSRAPAAQGSKTAASPGLDGLGKISTRDSATNCSATRSATTSWAARAAAVASPIAANFIERTARLRPRCRQHRSTAFAEVRTTHSNSSILESACPSPAPPSLGSVISITGTSKATAPAAASRSARLDDCARARVTITRQPDSGPATGPPVTALRTRRRGSRRRRTGRGARPPASCPPGPDPGRSSPAEARRARPSSR